MVSKFLDDPTVEESGIVVLLWKILGLCGKRESYNAKNISFTPDIVSKIPMVRMFKISSEISAQISRLSNG